ncbi:MAG: hypothetical protein HY681_13960 [Chloroflexi bacterium]|nr:hypothetical protein [Chloroflexota bacterium]
MLRCWELGTRLVGRSKHTTEMCAEEAAAQRVAGSYGMVIRLHTIYEAIDL